MNKLKHILFFSFLIFCAITSFAQNFAIKGGLNLSEIYEREENFINEYDLLPGVNLGCNIEFGVFRRINFETGLFLNNKGFKFSEEILLDGNKLKTDLTVSFYYFEIPFTLKRVNRLNTETTQYFLFGLYLASGLEGRMKLTIFTPGQKITEKYGLIWGEHFQKTDFGMKTGLGWEKRKMILEILYNYGLVNIIPNADNKSNYVIRNMALSFTFGYKLSK